MAVRAVRGATLLDKDERDHLLGRVAELLRAMLDRNALTTEDLISILFTATQDVRSAFPATAARELGLFDVPLLGAAELAVDGAMPRTVRVMAHVETDLARGAVQHVYLHGAQALRPDL